MVTSGATWGRVLRPRGAGWCERSRRHMPEQPAWGSRSSCGCGQGGQQVWGCGSARGVGSSAPCCIAGTGVGGGDGGDLYAVLGVARTASAADIKQAFRCISVARRKHAYLYRGARNAWQLMHAHL
eukprot:365910-Chlamydomonas_euryale.AAC.5